MHIYIYNHMYIHMSIYIYTHYTILNCEMYG